MNDFFERFNSVYELSPQMMSDSLSFGLSWPGSGEKAPERFAARVEKFYPDFIASWKDAHHKHQLSDVLRAVEMLITRINTIDTVDLDMPLFRGRKNAKNSFTYVRILKSLARLLAGQERAEEFLAIISSPELKPSWFLFLAARAQLLLAQGEYRKAADIAFQAKRLRPYDLCVSKTVFATQEALSNNGMIPDVEYDFGNKDILFCEEPFTVLNINSRTDADDLSFGLCSCRAWSPMAFEFSKVEPWNGEEAQEMRRSILDGSFKYCDKLKCPKLRKYKLPRSEDIESISIRNIIDNNLTEIPRGPKLLILAYDLSCNLSCPSCRSKIIMADSMTVKSFDTTIINIVERLLPDVQELQMTQTGEALASAHFRRLLKTISPSKYPNLKIRLMSNTKLLSQKTWQNIGSGAECIDALLLSIDGATPKTLEKLRRGLSWSELIGALEFAKELRRSSKISYLLVKFIVQKENFRELPKMLELCSQYCCDALSVAPIASRGSYTVEKFMEINVNDHQNPLNSEYREIQENVKLLSKQMHENEKELLAQGRSVPRVVFS